MKLVDTRDSSMVRRQYDQVHLLLGHNGLAETWLVSDEAGSNCALNLTQRLYGKSRCL